MSEHEHTPTQAKILTVSDGVRYGTREDRSGATLQAHLSSVGYEVVERALTEDGSDAVRDLSLIHI